MKLQLVVLISGLAIARVISQGFFSPAYSASVSGISGTVTVPFVDGKAVTINDYHAIWKDIDSIFKNFRVDPSEPFTATGGFTTTETSSGVTNRLDISFSPELPLPDPLPNEEPGASTVLAFLFDCEGVCSVATLSLPPDEEVFTYNGVPVPESLTVFGSGMAFGFGVLFNKKYSRKQKRLIENLTD